MTDPNNALVGFLTDLDDDAFETNIAAARSAREQKAEPKTVAQVMAARARAREHPTTRRT